MSSWIRLQSNINKKKKLYISNENNDTNISTLEIIPKSNVFNIRIITTENLLYIATTLEALLKTNNIITSIGFNLSSEECIQSDDNTLYIILFDTRTHDLFPKKYIVYQLEQSSSPYFTDKYINLLKNATYIWENNSSNFNIYKDHINTINYYSLPIPICDIYNNDYNNEYKYDIYFYGTLNDRRIKILEALKYKYNIIYGFHHNDIKKEYIKKSKIILNLHYYDNTFLETSRINECLLYNKCIISEDSHKYSIINESYKDIIHIVPIINSTLSNINILYNTIDNILRKKLYILNNTVINKINTLKQQSLYMFNKLLLPIIPYNKLILSYPLNSNVIYCLTLLETSYRIDDFYKQLYRPQLEYFYGIKYSPGWIGTGLSYKTLIDNAIVNNLNTITICEDDCLFTEYYKKNMPIIKEFLQYLDNDWDIFVGAVADFIDETNISKVWVYKNVTFIQIDRFTSMVYNIYNKSSFEHISKWDYTNTDVHNNTIDRYLSLKKLRIIVPVPFIVKCCYTLSTLWGISSNYDNLFQESLNKINNRLKTIENIIYV